MKTTACILIIIGILTSAAPTRAEVLDRIIAIVNDDIITLKEVENYVHVETKNQFTSVDEYLRNMKLKERLDYFITSLLIKQQARKLKIDVSDREVESIIENIKKQNLISDVELKEQLKKDNVTYPQFVEGIRINVLRSRVLTRVVSPEMNITEAMMRDYYARHKDSFRPVEFHLKQIFISGQRPDASKRAQEAYKQLEQGKTFEQTAVEFSDDPSGKQGGDIGSVQAEDLLPALSEAVGLLVRNTYTNIVQTPYGFTILKLVDTNKGEIVPFESLKEKINEQIVLEESNKRYDDYINKLRKSSYIEVKI